jgi:hypothetical protein
MTDAERELVTLTLNAVRAAALANRKFQQMTTLGASGVWNATTPRRGRPPKFEAMTNGGSSTGGGRRGGRRRSGSRRAATSGGGVSAELR